MLADLMHDLRYAVRTLIKQPGFTAVAVLTLALGIGANSAIFSVVNAVLLRPLPYRNPDRLVMVWDTNREQFRDHDRPSPGNFLDWRSRGQVFDGLTAWYETSRTLRSEHEAEQIQVAQVVGDYFRVFGIAAAAGRTFSPEEVPGVSYNSANQYISGDRLVVISDGLWRRRFGGDPGVVGRMISLDGRDWQVLGVMPAGFALPGHGVDLWIPWDIARPYNPQRFPDGPPRDFRFLHVLGRLKAGVTLEQAQARMAALAAELETRYPKANKGWGVRLVPLHGEIVGDSRAALLVLFGAVGFVLLIACANVASLLLVRASGRQREVAVRIALGASRLRLIQQLLTESVMLATAGGVIGLALAFWGKNLLMLLNPGKLPRVDEVGLDVRVLVFTFVVAVATGIICGLAPALEGSKADLTAALKEGGSKGATSSLRHHRFRSLLVASEVAIALVLLVGAGLLARSFARVLAVNPGFDSKHLLVMRIFLDNNSYRTAAQSSAYFQTLIERLRALPSVNSVAATTALPMSDVGVDFDRPFWREGESDPGGAAPKASIRMVTPDYFKTMSIPVQAGRAFTEHDQVNTPAVLMVNETMARQVWPGQDAVGKQLVINYNRGKYPYEVVGVASDTKFYGLKSQPQPEIFIPHAQNSYLTMNVVVRTAASPQHLAQAVRQEALKLDPAQPVHSIVTMEELMARSVGPDRFSMLLLGLLAAIALVLAVVGIYGIMAYLVSQRAHEIGVRLALGARPSDVLKLVLGESLKLTLIGLGLGLVATLVLTRVISGLLYEVSATDPLTLAGVALLLTSVALLAGYIPARRALRVDPMVALRYE